VTSTGFDGTVLPNVTSGREPGVTLTRDLSPSARISEIARKGHQRANAISRCFASGETVLLVRAFVTLAAHTSSRIQLRDVVVTFDA